MANPEHLKKLQEGVEAWNEWRDKNPGVIPDLSDADLRGAKLTRADLNKVQLGGANLVRANLFDVNLGGADLTFAHLSKAYLSKGYLAYAKFTNADLNEADLSQAYLGRADFTRTDLKRTNFTGCLMDDTTFVNVDLSKAKGLIEVEHHGPSSIGIDTIYRSQGTIPEIFLRGAGVSDEMIVFIRAMSGAIQFYSCFISYSSKDQLFAERLYEALQAQGVRCWFAPHDVQGGKKLHEQIDDAIRVHERLLLLLSPDSINSEWVKTEIAKARKREVTERRRMLFPVRLRMTYKELQDWECFDADTGKDTAREIREYYIPDFTEWESAAKFKEEFMKLIRDLKKADEAKKAAEA